MSETDFKEPFNIFYTLGLIVTLLLPTLPATLAWIQMFNS